MSRQSIILENALKTNDIKYAVTSFSGLGAEHGKIEVRIPSEVNSKFHSQIDTAYNLFKVSLGDHPDQILATSGVTEKSVRTADEDEIQALYLSFDFTNLPNGNSAINEAVFEQFINNLITAIKPVIDQNFKPELPAAGTSARKELIRRASDEAAVAHGR